MNLRNRKLKELLLSVLMVLTVVIVILLLLLSVGGLYKTTNFYELRAFNKINYTDYSIKEWELYKYEIKRLHPFKEKE